MRDDEEQTRKKFDVDGEWAKIRGPSPSAREWAWRASVGVQLLFGCADRRARCAGVGAKLCSIGICDAVIS